MPVKGKTNKSSQAIPKTVQLSPADRKFHEELQKAAGPIPRYLFRAWSGASGGDPRLNTTEAITPHACVNGDGPASFQDLPEAQIRSLWDGHFDGTGVNSVFSWSQSLQFSICGYGNSHGYLSIVDTQQLASHNFVAYTHSYRSFGLQGCWYEYYIFGTVSGDAHRAVRLQDFPRVEGTLKGCVLLPKMLITLDDIAQAGGAVAAARQRGAIFGPKFELVVACQFLAGFYLPCSKLPEKVVKQLAEGDDVQQEWLEDPTIELLGASRDATIAGAFMKAAAQCRYGVPRSKTTFPEPQRHKYNTSEYMAMVKAWPASGTHGTLYASKEGIQISENTGPHMSPPVVPLSKDVAKLAIDMKGWDLKSLMGHEYNYVLEAAAASSAVSSQTDEQMKEASPPSSTAAKSAIFLKKDLKGLYIDMEGWKREDVAGKRISVSEVVPVADANAAHATAVDADGDTEMGDGE
ncbi:hypothetical protein LTR56_002976 [Elasticomyces elasticus]|nr:hypothetical protein LTR22_014699 [Elasticomyces elasticus]KAK3656628.1 hypothetical protein LTR56_002976 [Elasticomyces elasticus]KAK4930760.1 hypothetical protein LTR49_002848 [Elasticomyces elasticus]KAK5755611.1 hypothetical protein LTS12_014270 [Elasticomyces elasticus]